MTGTYSAVVTGGFVPNTDSLAIELDAPANTAIRIKKIRITPTDGTDTTVNDFHRKIKLVFCSTTGTGSAYTPIELDDNGTPSITTVETGPATAGTISTTLDTISLHSGTDFLWQAADEEDKIVIQPGGIFAIVVNPSA